MKTFDLVRYSALNRRWRAQYASFNNLVIEAIDHITRFAMTGEVIRIGQAVGVLDMLLQDCDGIELADAILRAHNQQPINDANHKVFFADCETTLQLADSRGRSKITANEVISRLIEVGIDFSVKVKDDTIGIYARDDADRCKVLFPHVFTISADKATHKRFAQAEFLRH